MPLCDGYEAQNNDDFDSPCLCGHSLEEHDEFEYCFFCDNPDEK